jgi:TonB-dependent starch-binding outer membrane protein SusC
MPTGRRMLATIAALLLVPAAAAAQERGTLTGQVTDQATGQPLVGVQVSVTGTQVGALTNQMGRFLIPGVPAGPRELRATLIGYSSRTQSVAVIPGQSVTVDFALAQSAVAIEGVVVTAGGREERTRSIGNSVGSIAVADVPMAAVTNMADLLQARSAGVTVTQSSGTSGTGSRIRIRGSNSVSLSNEPLVIVDGVRVNTGGGPGRGFTNIFTGGQDPSRLDDFNPDDIESIEILKGPAAAALYGTAAANGVIQITTRRGRAGPARWNAYSEQGQLRDRTPYPASFAATTRQGGSGPGGACVVYDLAMGSCSAVPGLQSYNPLRDPDATPFVNGRRELYGLSVSGGSDQVTYFVSGELEDERGVFAVNRLERVNVRANVNARLNERMELAIRSGYVDSRLALPTNDNALFGVLLNGLLGTGSREVNQGYYDVTPEQIFSQDVGQDVQRVTGGLTFNYRPLPWLSGVATTGLDRFHRHDTRYQPPNIITSSLAYREGFRTSNRVEVTTLTSTGNVTGTFELRPNLAATTSAGAQFNVENYYDTRGFGQGMAPGASSLQGASKLFSASENTIENRTIGTYVQQQLALNDRLFLTGAVRGDENSAFGSAIGFIWYPSVSASWVVSEEPFFPRVPGVSSLRLRSAYGRSGLRPSFREAITYYSPVSARVDGAELPAVTLAGTGSVELRPEVSTELEVGFDAGFASDRFGVEVTFYDKESSDALIDRRLAPSLGLTTSAFDNLGRVSNRGLEALLRAQVLNGRTAEWNVTLSGSVTRNRLEELGEEIEPIIFGGSRNRQRHQEGYALGGFWQRPISFNDANGDGLLQRAEVSIGDTAVYMGQPFPTREAAFSTNLTLFRVVRVAGLLDFKGGHKMMNFTRFDRCSWEQLCEQTYVRESASLRDQAAWIAYNILEPNTNTALYLEDADFVKLRELSFTLSAPDEWARRLRTGSLRLTLSGRNLKTWTDYRGFDPEVNQFGTQNFATQDYYTQPPLHHYVARIDVNF